MKELLPEWGNLEKLVSGLQSSGKLALQGETGLPYFFLRLALRGISLFVISDENKAETWAEDFRALSNFFDSFKSWSVGLFPENLPKERAAMIEEAVESGGNVWFGSKESFFEKCF